VAISFGTDDAVVAAQLERPLRARADVVVRCHLGLPVVTRVPPLLEDGTPFPTRWWLTCPLATRRIGRLEAAGAVRSAERYLGAEPAAAARMQAAHRRYADERDEAVPPGADRRPTGGVAGIRGEGVKCLHAHYADHAAGHDNPVGELVAPWVEPLDCPVPCVREPAGRAERNPDWREPP
jgi:hypothetical protein